MRKHAITKVKLTEEISCQVPL